MNKDLQIHVETFNKNVERVSALMGFDRQIIDLCLEMLTEFRDQHAKEQKFKTLNNLLTALIQSFEPEKAQKRLKPQYETMYNQCLVLLISHFSTALRDLYVTALEGLLREKKLPESLKEEELKIPLSALEGDELDHNRVAIFILEKDDNSFQDMQSIRRAFEDRLSCRLERDAMMDDIILAQACRNSIVHAGERISDRTVRQLRDVKKRTLFLGLKAGDKIQFSTGDLTRIMNCMKKMVETLSMQLSSQLG
jgi:hypothetical protein